jgi:hypothetical protein
VWKKAEDWEETEEGREYESRTAGTGCSCRSQIAEGVREVVPQRCVEPDDSAEAGEE